MDDPAHSLTPRRNRSATRQPAGRAAAALLLGALAALHLAYAFRLRADSDEPQHLHVVWGWTQGMLPYRDFFDNHSPLFSWLYAPVLAALGARADILPWMRLAVLPLNALCLWEIYWLGRHLFDRRAGVWAAILTGFFPPYFYLSTEFRPDILWAAGWLALLAVLLTGPLTLRRWFLAGVVAGVTLATSMKTVLLLATLGVAAAGTWAGGRLYRAGALPAEGRRVPPAGGAPALQSGGIAVAAAVAGAALVPGAFAAFFWLSGAWKPFVYCLITHNALPGLGAAHDWWERLRPWLFALALPGLLAGTLGLRRRGDEASRPRRARQAFFCWAACGYPLLLASFWPLLTTQDLLPATPPLALALAAALWRALPGRLPALRTVALAGLIFAETATIFLDHGPWRDRLRPQRELLAAVLRLTTPADPVMDDKGETIFRRRPYYFALEDITRRRLGRGLLADDIAARLAASGTAVVHAAALPPAAGAFVRENYLSVGVLSVLGKAVPPEAPGGPDDPLTYRFEVAVPARYVVINARGELASGLLDGQPPGPEGTPLAAGAHAFVAPRQGVITLFWANAWKQGFRPAAPVGVAAPSNG